MLLLAHGEEKTGVLVDAKCGVQLADQSSEAAKHEISCALQCKDSGFGIITAGKFYRFDDSGNRQALFLLKATEKKSNLKVRVGGHISDDLIEVEEIETIE
jgi:hypothetical protein